MGAAIYKVKGEEEGIMVEFMVEGGEGGEVSIISQDSWGYSHNARVGRESRIHLGERPQTALIPSRSHNTSTQLRKRRRRRRRQGEEKKIKIHISGSASQRSLQ